MEARAVLKYLRIAPRKVRVVANELKGRYVGEALGILKFVNRRAARPLSKVIKSALDNAKQKGASNLDDFYIKELMVDEGPTWKRYLPRAMGRATRIRKRTSHVKVVVSDE